MTANQIAKIFKDAVLWNRIGAGSINSYAQILRVGDDFYTLTDRDAFSALLNDYLSDDNQLQDIFMDLYDAGLGVQKFAEAGQRASARQIVAYFLNINKYSYHKSDVAKVYLAVNTWLVFFGAAQEKPSWDVCPFCGGSFASNVCTSKSCRKTTAECLSAMAELEELLIKEQDGVKTKQPAYWGAIKHGTEFDQFKTKLNKYYAEREQAKQLEAEKKNKEIIAVANEALGVLSHKIDIELQKDDPDYDMLLSWIADAPEVKEASKCKDKKFKENVKALGDKITSHKRNREQAEIDKKRRKKRKTIVSIVLSSVALVLLLAVGAFYFGYWKPLKEYPFLTEELTAQECSVTGLKDEHTSVLKMGEKSANGWFLKGLSVVSVAEGAFKDNKNINKAYLPSSVRQIGAGAFSGCTVLNAVHLASRTPPEITGSTFSGVSAHFFVPEESYVTYLSSPYWSGMADNIFPDYDNEDGYGCIIFDANGGEDVSSVRTHALGTVAPELPQPQKAGYNFAGWFTSEGMLVTSGHTAVSSDIKLTAQWTPRAYSITFEANGGTLSGETSTDYTVETGASLPAATKTGYSFGGWYLDSNLIGKPLESIDIGTMGDIKLFAKWTPNTYTICFKTYGGTAFENLTVQTEEQVTFRAPAPPATGQYSKGYMFTGWALVENGSATNGDLTNLIDWTKSEDGYIVPPYAENGRVIVLYAVWETTPMEWFSFDMVDGKLVLTGLTPAWENYNGVLDKTILYLPEQYGTATLYAIGDGAFENRTELNTVSIPNTVVKIGSSAFRGCTSLRTVLSAENVEDIGTEVFTDTLWIGLCDDNSWFRTIGKILLGYNYFGGYQITEDNFPQHVTIIASGAFKDSRSLIEGKEDEDYLLVIPARITRIGDEAFANSLFNVLEWNPVRAEIGETIFRGCTFKEIRSPIANFDIGSMFSESDENNMGFLIYTGTATEIVWHGENLSFTKFSTAGAANGKLTTVSLLEFNNIGHVYLGGLQLTSLNYRINGNTEVLEIWGNKFGLNFYVKADTIETVEAYNSQITKVGATSYGFYKGFAAKRIGTLNLYGNKITALELDQAESVGTLNMSNNTGMTVFDVGTVHATRLILTNSGITELISKKNNEAVANNDVKIIFMPTELTSANRLSYAQFELMPNLISLDIANQNIDSVESIVKLKNLQELYLGGNPAVKSYYQMNILLTASFLPKLTRLNLGGGNNADSAGVILDIVKKCNNLTWLELYAIDATSSNIASKIASAITKSTHSKLVYLKISHNGFTVVPDSLKYIKKVVIDFNDTSRDV